MLRLLDSPHWDDADGRRVELPATLPLWLIAYLVVRADWVPRTQLAAVFWPDRGDEEAQHNLRVNLHRVKQVIAGRGELHAERSRVRLEVASDVAVLRARIQCGDAAGALEAFTRPLLDGASPRGFPALESWVELERSGLTQTWRELMLSTLRDGRLEAARSAVVAQRLLAIDPCDETAAAWRLEAHLAGDGVSDGLRFYADFAQRLRDTLGVEPAPRLQALQQRLLAWATALPQRPAGGSHERFVGRALELAQLRAMLAQERTRWITIVGPGGIGKTRLARELRAPGDAWIALADAGVAAQIGPRLAAALGLSVPATRDALDVALEALADTKPRRLWFDNAEQIEGASSLFDRLVADAPTARIIVTSREPFGAASERLFRLDGMMTPPDDLRDAALAREADAVALFELRALAADPDFSLEAQLDGVLALIDRVGGWPLAIELAAAWMQACSAAEIAAELGASIELLARDTDAAASDARHASLHACIAWSWRRLAPPAQAMLASLSVFCGGFTRAAVAAVTADAGAHALVHLVAQGLVRVAGGARYELHPLVAVFAARQLVSPVDAAATRRRHTMFFMQRLAALGQPGDAVAPVDIEADFENFAQAWHAAIDTGELRLLASAAPAWEQFCQTRGRVREVLPLINAALSAVASEASTDGHNALAQLRNVEAGLRYMGGDLERAEAAARQAWLLCEGRDDADLSLGVLNTLALVLQRRSRHDEAARFATLGLERARQSRHRVAQAAFAGTCGMLARARGDYQEAQALYAEGAELYRQLGDHAGVARTLMNLGVMHHARREWPAAQLALEDAVRVAELHDVRSTLAYALGALAWTHLGRGQPEAARHFAQRVIGDAGADSIALASAHAAAARSSIELDELAVAATQLAAAAQLALASRADAQLLVVGSAHARRLLRLQRHAEAAAHLEFVAAHPATGAAEREAARELLDGLGLDAQQSTQARRSAAQLTLTRLADEVRAAARQA